MATLHQYSIGRLTESLRWSHNLDKVEPGFGLNTWALLCEILGIKDDFKNVKIPVIPMKYRMTDHDRHEFRQYILAVPQSVILKSVLEIVRQIFAEYDGSEIEIDSEILTFSETNADRRNKSSYLLRYKDSPSYYNGLMDHEVERLVRKKNPNTMSLMEVLLRLIYYIVIQQRLPDDRMGSIICPETVVNGKVVVVRLATPPMPNPKGLKISDDLKPIESLEGLRSVRLSYSPLILRLTLEDPKGPFDWNAKPRQVLV